MKREEKLVKNTIILAIGTFLPRVASYSGSVVKTKI